MQNQGSVCHDFLIFFFKLWKVKKIKSVMNFVLSFTQTKEKYIPYFREFMKKICFRRNYSWKYGKLPNRQFTFYFFGRTNALNFRNFCHFIEEFYMTVILCRIICQIFLIRCWTKETLSKLITCMQIMSQ